MSENEINFDFIVSDDADKYLASLSPEQLCPKFGQNGLPTTTGSFSPEEIDLALNIFCP